MKKFTIYLLGLLAFGSCKNEQESKESKEVAVSKMEAIFDNKDYTYSNAEEVVGKHLFLDIEVDFEKHQIKGVATWDIEIKKTDAKHIIFDTRDLEIDSVLLNDGSRAQFWLGDRDEILGAQLTVAIKPTTKQLSIYYKTSTTATALQWLAPSQTFGKQKPFLYTQSESIHARTGCLCRMVLV
jgi:leukotriene-A4 hydrolase